MVGETSQKEILESETVPWGYSGRKFQTEVECNSSEIGMFPSGTGWPGWLELREWREEQRIKPEKAEAEPRPLEALGFYPERGEIILREHN